MSYPKDNLGAWIRPMEQRFRALAAGAINVKQFLDHKACHVFEDRDVEAWSIIYMDPSVQIRAKKYPTLF